MDIWISSILAMTNSVVNNIIVQMYSCASVKCLWELILEATVSLFCLGLIELLETAMLYLAPNLRKIWPFLLFWLCLAAARILIPSPGTEPVSPEVEAWSPNCWTARGFAKLGHFFKKYFFLAYSFFFFFLFLGLQLHVSWVFWCCISPEVQFTIFSISPLYPPFFRLDASYWICLLFYFFYHI